MSFPRYPKYKPSGVEWLADVPTVAGSFQLPSARLSLILADVNVLALQSDGTWNVPATLETRP